MKRINVFGETAQACHGHNTSAQTPRTQATHCFRSRRENAIKRAVKCHKVTAYFLSFAARIYISESGPDISIYASYLRQYNFDSGVYMAGRYRATWQGRQLTIK